MNKQKLNKDNTETIIYTIIVANFDVSLLMN